MNGNEKWRISQRELIVEKLNNGMSKADIAKELGISRSTVYLWARRWNEGQGLNKKAEVKSVEKVLSSEVQKPVSETQMTKISQRATIVAKLKSGFSPSYIARELGIARGTVYRWGKRWVEAKSLRNNHNGGTTPKTSPIDDQMIENALKFKPYLTYKDIKRKLNLNVSATTIRRRILNVKAAIQEKSKAAVTKDVLKKNPEIHRRLYEDEGIPILSKVCRKRYRPFSKILGEFASNVLGENSSSNEERSDCESDTAGRNVVKCDCRSCGIVKRPKLKRHICHYEECERKFHKEEQLKEHIAWHEQKESTEDDNLHDQKESIEDLQISTDNLQEENDFEPVQITDDIREIDLTECDCPNCKDGISIIMPEDERHNCHYEGCERAFADVSLLKYHISWHDGKLPYVCSWRDCDMSFKQCHQLNIHIREHRRLVKGDGRRKKKKKKKPSETSKRKERKQRREKPDVVDQMQPSVCRLVSAPKKLRTAPRPIMPKPTSNENEPSNKPNGEQEAPATLNSSTRPPNVMLIQPNSAASHWQSLPIILVPMVNSVSLLLQPDLATSLQRTPSLTGKLTKEQWEGYGLKDESIFKSEEFASTETGLSVLSKSNGSVQSESNENAADSQVKTERADSYVRAEIQREA